MNKDLQQETWVLSSDEVFADIGLEPDDYRHIQEQAPKFLEAITKSVPANEISSKNSPEGSASASLFIPGKRYHINISKAAKEVITDAARTVAVASALESLRLVDFTVTLSVRGIATLLGQLTRLSDTQRKMVQRILQMKKESGSRSYWPTTKELAKSLGVSQKRIEQNLMPLNGKVVALGAEEQRWCVLW